MKTNKCRIEKFYDRVVNIKMLKGSFTYKEISIDCVVKPPFVLQTDVYCETICSCANISLYIGLIYSKLCPITKDLLKRVSFIGK